MLLSRALALLISIGVRSLGGPATHDHSTLRQTTGWVGTACRGVSVLIAAINIVILLGIVKVFREMRTGRYDEAGLERQLDSRGLMNRLFGRLTKAVAKPRHMYPIGLLFGLGSTPRARSRSWSSPAAPGQPKRRGTRSSACRSSSPRVCR